MSQVSLAWGWFQGCSVLVRPNFRTGSKNILLHQRLIGRKSGISPIAEAPKAGTEQEQASLQVPAADIQAVLTVLGRREEKARQEDAKKRRVLKLTRTNLRYVNLEKAHFEHTVFLEAHLEHAALWRVHLQYAILWNAHFESAFLREADLEGALLREAHFEGANLQGAFLMGAHLEGAEGLTQAQLNSASGDAETMLPEGLTRPAHWSSTTPSEPDNPSTQR